MDDICVGFFGAGGEAMRAFYDTMDAALRQYPTKIEWGQKAYPQIFSPEVVTQCRASLDAAKQAGKDPDTQARVKMVIAYSTIAQVGYVFLLFPLAAGGTEAATLAWFGGIYFAVCHACAKAAAFLAAGVVLHCAGHDDLDRLQGLGRLLPVAFFAFGAAGVNLVGLPPSGGFLAKWLMLRAAIGQGAWPIALVLVTGSLLAAGYIVRVLERAISEPEASASPAAVRRVRSLAWSTLALALVPLLLGVMARVPLALLAVGSPVGGLP